MQIEFAQNGLRKLIAKIAVVPFKWQNPSQQKKGGNGI